MPQGKKTPYDLSCEFILSLKVTGIPKKPPMGWGVVENGANGAIVKDVQDLPAPEAADEIAKLTVDELKQILRLYSARGITRSNGKKITMSGLKKADLIALLEEVKRVEAEGEEREWDSDDEGDY